MKTKFCVFFVLIFCVCIGQIRSEYGLNAYENAKNALQQVAGLSEQFSDDFTVISQKFQNDSRVIQWLHMGLLGMLYRRIPKEKGSKIDLNQLRDFHSTDFYYSKQFEGAELATEIDKLKELKSILSREFQPERYNGIINLIYIFRNPKATSEEIENSLNYLYGNDTSVTNTSFIDSRDFWNLSASDCPTWTRMYSEEIDKLKSMIDIKSKVVEDFNAIHEKFPCAYNLDGLIHTITQFHGRESKIDACMMKGYFEDEYVIIIDGQKTLRKLWHIVKPFHSREYIESQIKQTETLFSTKLSDETYRDIINLKRVSIPGTPVDEIEKALEYVYDDVPKKMCPDFDNLILKN